MLVAAGQIDSIEVAHSHICRDTTINDEADGKPRDRKRYPSYKGNAEWSQEIYFRLLECGLRIPPTAGSGSGESPNPVGYNRVYVHVDGEFTYEKWWQNLRAGQVFVTNGPLMKPSVEGELPGHVFQADAGAKLEFEIGLTLSTREPISYLEIIKDGHVEHEIRFDEYAKSGKLPKLQFDRSGWFLIRAVTDVPKTYRFAMTGPYYVEIGYQRRISKSAAQFFLDWVVRAGQADQAGRSRSSSRKCSNGTARPAISGRIWCRRRTRSDSPRKAAIGGRSVLSRPGQRPGSSPSPGHRPGETITIAHISGPTGQPFAERLARWADNDGSRGPIPQGDALGWANSAPSGQAIRRNSFASMGHHG